MGQKCLRYYTFDIQPDCAEYQETWLKDRHGMWHFRCIIGSFVLTIAGLLLIGAVLFSRGGPTPNVGDVRTQVYQCHRTTTYIQSGKVLVPSSGQSCDWETTDYVRNGPA